RAIPVRAPPTVIPFSLSPVPPPAMDSPAHRSSRGPIPPPPPPPAPPASASTSTFGPPTQTYGGHGAGFGTDWPGCVARHAASCAALYVAVSRAQRCSGVSATATGVVSSATAVATGADKP